jgi:mannose-6-phosphate isomerase-like protein (cupin superfamily)
VIVAGAARTPGTVSEEDALAIFAAEGSGPARPWANGPGDAYGLHEHDRPKVLFCTRGSIKFHTRDGDVEITAGDRLDLPPGTEHAATVGPEGCACVEAWA